MGLDWLILFAVFFFIVSAIREGTKAAKRTPRPTSRQAERRDTVAELRDAFANTSPGLRDLLDAIEQAHRGPTAPTPAPARARPAARDDKPDDFTSLETGGEEVVVERAPDRAARREVDLDEESIAAAERRRAWADRRDVPARPRGAPAPPVAPVAADATAVAVPAPGPSLRQAVIWREILGPPRSLRDD